MAKDTTSSTPSDSSAPKGGDANPASVRADAGFARKFDGFFVSGVAVGLVLAGFGFFFNAVNPLLAQLAFVCGLGLVLGAFGTMATVSYKPFVMGGAGAIALILGVFLNQQADRGLTQLRIKGFDDVLKITIIGAGETLFGRERERAYEFVALNRQLETGTMDVIVEMQRRGEDGETVMSELVFECIPMAYLKAGFRAGRSVEWRLNIKDGWIIDDGDEANEVLAQVGPCRREARAREDKPSPLTRMLAFVGLAHAMDAAQSLEDLKSSSTVTRRAARSLLAEEALINAEQMLTIAADPKADYQTRLGVVVALTEYLRANKDKRKELATLISDEHMAFLVRAAADSDRSMRIYATEFLYDLGDPRVADMALHEIETSSDEGRFQLLFALRGAVPDLSAEQRARVAAGLNQITLHDAPKTQALVEQIATEVGDATVQEQFHVIAGAFANQDNALKMADRLRGSGAASSAFVATQRPDDPLFRVIAGTVTDHAEAEKLRAAVLSAGLSKDAYISTYPDKPM